MRARPLWTIAIGALITALASFPAVSHAQQAASTARLVYLRGPGTDSCPNEVELRDAVSARLGYDPFLPFSLDTLFAEVDKEGTGFVARVKLVSHDNTVRGARSIRASGACSDLIASLALTISIAIDPMAGTRTGPPDGLPPGERSVEPIPEGPQKPVVVIDEPAQPAPAPVETAVRARISVGAGMLGSVATAPAVAVGFLAFGRVRIQSLSLALEARADLPAGADANGPGRVSSSLLASTLMPCAHTSLFFGCARGSLGLLRAEGLDVDEPGTSGAIWGALGARIGVEIPLSEIFALRIHGDGDVVLTRYALRFGDRTAFRYAPVAAGLGIAAVATFQ